MTSGSLHQFTIHIAFGSLTGLLGVKDEKGTNIRMADDEIEGKSNFSEYMLVGD